MQRLEEIVDSDNRVKDTDLKQLADAMYNYIETDGYKEIEWLKDGFIFWQD